MVIDGTNTAALPCPDRGASGPMIRLLLLVVLALLAGMVLYILFGYRRFPRLEQVRPKALSWGLSLLCLAPVGLFFFVNAWSVMIVLLHLFVFWVFCDLAGKLIRVLVHRRDRRHYVEGIAAILLTVVYLSVGWYNAHHVSRTQYTFQTQKDLGVDRLRVVEIADLHLGITLDGEAFYDQCQRINQERPDLVVVVGDYVDDDSCYEDMLVASRALGSLETTYGVYFVFGNHDKGYYTYRDFSSVQLRQALEDNRVTVLEDETVLIGDCVSLVGRQDRSVADRLDMGALTRDLDPDTYSIVLDHQPNDYLSESEAGVDLVLSGHTHGGHIFPAGQLGLAMGANDRIYGAEVRDKTTFVVTSGISGWAIPFKTGTWSEYVVIDITQT